MSTNLPVLFQASFKSDGGWSTSSGYASVQLTPAYGKDSAANAGGPGDPLNYVVIYDRKKPLDGPVFQANAPDNTTVPTGLAPYLTTDYIMFWATTAFVTQVPQGALYDMLNQNGGGAQLQRMETLSTKFSCGVSGGLVYLLATIPNAGVEGIELFQSRVTSSSGSGTSEVYSTQYGPYRMLMELVPAPNGMYTPVYPY